MPKELLVPTSIAIVLIAGVILAYLRWGRRATTHDVRPSANLKPLAILHFPDGSQPQVIVEQRVGSRIEVAYTTQDTFANFALAGLAKSPILVEQPGFDPMNAWIESTTMSQGGDTRVAVLTTRQPA